VLLSLALLGACALDVAFHRLGTHCPHHSGFCHEEGITIDFWIMVVPLAILLMRGGLAGVKQVRRTRTVLRDILREPRWALPQPVAEVAVHLGIERRLDTIANPIPEAFCYGLFRPRICITSGLVEALSLAELEAVLRHERHHLRCYDPLRIVIWTIISKTYWWLEAEARQAHLCRELAADRAVITEQGPVPLASALYKLLTLSHLQRCQQSDLALSGLSVTDARIDQIIRADRTPLSSRPRLTHWLMLPMVCIVVLLLCSNHITHP
jgi:Zn-dependent protease with chaperone function